MDLGYYGTSTERTNMKYFVLRKFKYIRGFEHDMPAVEKCKNGFDKLEDALEAKTCLEHLEHRPDMVSYIIVQEVQASSHKQQATSSTQLQHIYQNQKANDD